MGRAEDDDETWVELMDDEAGDLWMRDPHVPEVVEELLGGDLEGALQQEQRRQAARQQREQVQQQRPQRDEPGS